jgi:hypothetical protein
LVSVVMTLESEPSTCTRFTLRGGAADPNTVVTSTLSWSLEVSENTLEGSERTRGTNTLLFSKNDNDSIWLKQSFALPGSPIPRKNFAKPSIFSPGIFNFPEATAAKEVTPLTTEADVVIGPLYSAASTCFSSK